MVNRYITKAKICADIWHFSNIYISRKDFLFRKCVGNGTLILTALRMPAPEYTKLPVSVFISFRFLFNSSVLYVIR